MGTFGLQFNISQTLDSYNRLVSSLPPGFDNMTADLIVPSHTPQRPISFVVSNVTPNVPHIFHVTSEWGVAPTPTVAFVPSGDTAIVTLAMAYGPNSVVIQDNLGNQTLYTIAVTHYATIFLAEATELTNYSIIPLTNVQNAVQSPIGYLLASPFIGDVSRYIPTDLETLNTLGNKLLVKNLLWGPGTDLGVQELFAAYAASNPVLFKMENRGVPEIFLYRNEESFSGYEAHVWLPNREVERWQTFIQYINNLPQIYTLKQITEGEVWVQVGDTIHRHIFDFESDFANTVLEDILGDKCFANLFRLDMTIESEWMISFCEASYVLDGTLPPLLTPDTDPLGVTNFSTWSLTGRFEQQFDIADGIHGWVYDSPIIGVVDGVNRFFNLSETPASHTSIKLFIDGLLLRYLVDYRISIADDFRSDVYPIPISPSPILLDIAVGEVRPFIGPVFSSVQISGGADTEFLVVATDQTLTNVTFVMSEPPAAGLEEAKLHYVTPALPQGSYPAPNQYGTVALPLATVTYSLVFPVPASSIGYQLLVEYADDPSGPPSGVPMPNYIVRNHTLSGATIEFSEPISSANAQLHWWLIEGNIGLENGTATVPNTSLNVAIPFTNGPYLDQVVVIVRLWNINALGSIDMPFVSITNLNTVSFTVQFSNPINSADYRLDYVIFPSEVGDFLEIFAPPQPLQFVEAQYDTIWESWANTGPIELVEGISDSFTLPIPCPIHEAMYATMDGRVLTQGPNQQYLIESDNVTVRFSFIPQTGQRIWFVYPIVDPGTLLPPASVWNQGILTWGSNTPGSYAVGKILNDTLITPDDTVTIDGVVFTAQQTAVGSIFNPTVMLPGDFLTFVELGVTLTAVLNFTYTPPTVLGVFPNSSVNTPTANTITLNNHGILNNTIVYLYSTDILPAGLTPYTRYYVVNVSYNTFQLSLTFSGTPITLSSTGVGTHTISTGALPTEFSVNNSRDVDGANLVACINNNLGDIYLATYQGNGSSEIRALYLTGTSSNQTLTVGIGPTPSFIATNIVGDSPAALDEVQTITFPAVPTAGKFNLIFNNALSEDLPYNIPAVDMATAINALDGLSTVLVSGSVGAGFTVTFAATNGKQTQPLLSVANNQRDFLPADVIGDAIIIPQHGFKHGQTVGFFTTGTLPAGLSVGTNYKVFNATIGPLFYSSVATTVTVTANTANYFNGMIISAIGGTDPAVDGTYEITVTGPTTFTYDVDVAPGITVGTLEFIDGNTIKLTTAAPSVSIIPLIDSGTGTHTITLNNLTAASAQVSPTITETVAGYGNRFPSYVRRLNDSQALAASINDNQIINKIFSAVATEGTVSLTAKHVGPMADTALTFTGSSMRSTGIAGGAIAHHGRQPFRTPKTFYYADAPVVTLDGASTRRYEGYSGNSLDFFTEPETVQLPYIVSQVYPIDRHPLDSMTANQPCSYPKGVFTQALAASLADMEVDISETGSLTITTEGQPLQEAAIGVIDGVNVDFDMTLASCNGQNSLMVWVDGIFQPPTLYTYSVILGHGHITFLNPPQPLQKVWLWYLIASDACALEHVEALTGPTDGVNTSFAVPSGPFVDPPTLLTFLSGLLSLQGVEYSVDVGNTSITYFAAPSPGLSLWSHFNEGTIGTDKWLQLSVGVGNGVQLLWVLPTLLNSELPRSQDSVILALDGFVQREGIDFTVNTDITGAPDGFITFTTAPALGQKIQVAYLTRG